MLIMKRLVYFFDGYGINLMVGSGLLGERFLTFKPKLKLGHK